MSERVSDDWVYEVSENGRECTIKRYMGKEKNIVVPEYCDGYPVTAFGNNVSCVFITAKVQTVVLPSTVAEILSCAFLSCITLEEVVLPMGLCAIGNNAFCGCTSLKKIELPAHITCIEHRTFCYCESLNSLVIPASVKEIKACAFLGCCKLKQVTFCEGLEIIGHYAFGLTDFSKIIIPHSIRNIESDSFDEGVSVESE